MTIFVLLLVVYGIYILYVIGEIKRAHELSSYSAVADLDDLENDYEDPDVGEQADVNHKKYLRQARRCQTLLRLVPRQMFRTSRARFESAT